MINLKNITNETYKKELELMLKDHYRELYGENWPVKNFYQRMRDKRSFSTHLTSEDMRELFIHPVYGTVAYGIFSDEELIGMVLLDIIKSTKKNLEVETYGQLYQLYIKKEYREFIKDNDFMDTLKDFIDDYFKAKGMGEVITKIPDELAYLIECSKYLGFTKTKTTDLDSGISQTLWEKKI